MAVPSYSRTKLVPPSRLLDAAVPGEDFGDAHLPISRIITIEAPAGCGKTTRVLQLLEQSDRRTAWVTIAPPLDGIAGFWAAVLCVLKPSVPDDEGVLEFRFETAGEQIESALISLCNALAAESRGIDLVLDDFHKIGEEIEDSLLFFLDNIPETVRVWILSRREISLPLAPFVLRGEHVGIGREELRLNRDQCAEVLRRITGDVDDAVVSAVYNHTQGWPAAVQVLARMGTADILSERPPGIFPTAGTSFPPGLAGEILAVLPDSEREFVLRTSILPTFTADEAGEMADERSAGDSRFFLDELRRRGFFLTATTGTTVPIYEYLPFFRDILAGYRAERPLEYAESVRRAVNLLERRGAIEPAVATAMESADYDEAARLLADHAEAWMSNGRYGTFLRQVRELPGAVVRGHQPLSSLATWARTLYAQDCPPEELQSPPGETGVAREIRSAARAYDAFYRLGSFEATMESLDEAALLAESRYRSLASIVDFVGIVALRMSGDCETAYQKLSGTPRESSYSASPYVGVLHDLNLGNLLSDLRRTPEALALYEDSRSRLTAACGTDEFPFWGLMELEAALAESRGASVPGLSRRIARGIRLAEEHGIDEILSLGHTAAAQITASSDIQTAYSHIDTALAHSGSSRWGRRIFLATCVRLAALFDTPHETRRWHAQMHAADVDADLGAIGPRLADAWCAMASGNVNLAVDLAHALAQEQQATPFERLEASLLETRLTFTPESARQSGLLAACRDEGLGRWACQLLFSEKEIASNADRDTGEPIPFSADVIPDDETIRGMRDIERDVDVDGFVEKFPGREIQILQLMARGATNSEIADTIYISVNTVRWYARQIYAKLQVRRRGEAVRAAWHYGLIGNHPDS